MSASSGLNRPTSYHFRDWDPENLQALSHADKEFGRILDWQHSQNEESHSDHHLFGSRSTHCLWRNNQPSGVSQEAGFTVGESPEKMLTLRWQWTARVEFMSETLIRY